jgi:hypothetical protein
MEEVFLAIFAGDEPEPALGDDLLHGTCGHDVSWSLLAGR